METEKNKKRTAQKQKRKPEKLWERKHYQRKPETVQETLPFQEIYKDGICQVSENSFNKTMEFFDINFQLESDTDKDAILKRYKMFLNHFSHTTKIQITFINQQIDVEKYAEQVVIKPCGDGFDDLRAEYSEILKEHMWNGNNGIIRRMFITFGIEAKNLKDARPRLARIENGIIINFKPMGVWAKPLNGMERLELLQHLLHMDKKTAFGFDYHRAAAAGVTSKDYVAPDGLDFRNNTSFKMGNVHGRVVRLQLFGANVTEEMIRGLMELNENMLLNIHYQPMELEKSLKMLKGRHSDTQAMKITEQERAFQKGHDTDLIARDINVMGGEAERFLEDVQSKNEQAFHMSVILTFFSPVRSQLDQILEQASGMVTPYGCRISNMMFLQEQGLISTLPIGVNQSEYEDILPTRAVAILAPFSTRELFWLGGIYYGVNALSGNMIIVDKKLLKNPNSIIIGTPGSGKSFCAKRELLAVFLSTSDDIIICDPEGEYEALVEALHGQIIHISAGSQEHINPMDVNLDVIYHPEKYRGQGDVDDLETIIRDKSAFIISFCEIIMKRKDGQGLEGDEESIIDKCVDEIYRPYLSNNPDPAKMPILDDLYEKLLEYGAQGHYHAQKIADVLQMYVTGSQNVFNYRTNVDMNNRVVCFDIKKLNSVMRKAGMFIIQNMVWTRVSQNRAQKKSTRYYADEFHLLLGQPQTAAYSIEIWKRFRKWGGLAVAMTQNVSDFLRSAQVEDIIGNSDFIILLNLHREDRLIMQKKLNLSDAEIKYITDSEAGEGLLKYGDVVVPFRDRYPKDTRTYALMTSKMEETR